LMESGRKNKNDDSFHEDTSEDFKSESLRIVINTHLFHYQQKLIVEVDDSAWMAYDLVIQIQVDDDGIWADS